MKKHSPTAIHPTDAHIADIAAEDGISIVITIVREHGESLGDFADRATQYLRQKSIEISEEIVEIAALDLAEWEDADNA